MDVRPSRLSVRVLARQGASALVKRCRGVLPYLRVALIWALGAWSATGAVGVSFATTWSAYYSDAYGTTAYAVWTEDGVGKYCGSNSPGQWSCCTHYDSTENNCGGSWVALDQPFLRGIYESFGPTENFVVHLVNDMFGGSFTAFEAAAGVTPAAFPSGDCPTYEWTPNHGYCQRVVSGDGLIIWACGNGSYLGCTNYPAPAGFGCAQFTTSSYWYQCLDLCGFCPAAATERGCDCGGAASCTGICSWEAYFTGGENGSMVWTLGGSNCAGGPTCACACPGVAATFSGQVAQTSCVNGGNGPIGCPASVGPCVGRGGDGDQDGCCADTDCNDGDPEKCAAYMCEPCYGRGGDGDQDGCCADVDCNDGDPEKCAPATCLPCYGHGGDGDGDGCCSDVDVDDGDAAVCAACTGNCEYVVAKVNGKFVWQLAGSQGSCGGAGCHCCPPVAEAVREGQSSSSSCTRGMCPTKCMDKGGDSDEDGCCAEDDHDDDDDQVCDGRCDGHREVCYRTTAGPDGELGTEDDNRAKCDPAVPVSPGGVECLCEKLKNGDKDHDECCDFDERNEAEMNDPEKGCECCKLDEQWRKAKGCQIEWEWARIWGQGPKIVQLMPETTTPVPTTRPTECLEESACTGSLVYTGGLNDGVWSWSSYGACSGTGCSACPPIQMPRRVGETVEVRCSKKSCANPFDLPQGDPLNRYMITFPLSRLTKGVVPDQTVYVPVTIQGWKDWLGSFSSSGSTGAVFDAVDDYRKWFRSALMWLVGVMLAGVILKELRV